MLCNENELFIKPSDDRLMYMGRIDTTDADAPVLVYPYTMVKTYFTGTSAKICLKNHRGCWDNYLGVIVDGVQKKLLLPHDDRSVTLTLAEKLDEGRHELIVFKRMDSCHTMTLLGFYFDKTAQLERPKPLPERKIEVYGDSVSAGEVSEAVDYVGKPDPKHQGEYSNSWYAYTAMTARKLNARLHDIAQGGIALLDDTGWFHAPDYIGIESTWDKIEYNPETGESAVPWDFKKYTPHVVIVAIGQNDNHPDDYMAEDYDCEKAKIWRAHYEQFVRNIRGKYPKALIILATTILMHDENWDKSIDEVCRKIDDEKIVHFLYSNNGAGTPGHIRIPEAEQMADELSAFIESFGDDVWAS